MSENLLNVGVVQDVAAEAFGAPGERTFRLRATTASGEVSLWLEKEQIVAFGSLAQDILDRIPESQGIDPRPVTSTAEITGEVTAKVGSLAISFDQHQNSFAIEATDLWDATLDVETLLMLTNRAQLATITDQVDDIIAGGRPRCPMCGRPITPGGHLCPPSNGHARVRDV